MTEAEAVDAATQAAVEVEATHARIFKKRQRRNTLTLAREQNRMVREMAGLPLREVDEMSDGEDSSGDKQIWLDPYYVFDRYFREKDGKGSRKDKAAVADVQHRQTCQILIVRWHVSSY
ncbi:hypothetical protein D1007_18127 [Hordeum vulgare]|nr:hypothetical protein D1007_18127 [Hordeum vulgare]